ncbi:MAG TPA: hypothetical protein VNN17_07015, partial [Terriglobia bacterium]|nr:hypothetical protein [Terriglobia bacterium]
MVGRLAAWLPAGDGGKLSQALRTALLLAAAAGSPAALGAAADWEPQGPSTATVLALEADPGTRGRFLAGTYFGGLYETRNGGASWSPIPTEFSTFSVFAIAFDIRFPSTVYAGTFNGGVYKSQDGGRTWRAVNEGLQDRNVLALAVDPYQPSGVLALTGTGLYRSADAGEHWAAVEIEPLRGVGMRCIAFDPRKPGWVYLGSEGKGVFRSRDGGITWEQFAEGMGDQSVNSLAFSNQSKRKLYASTSQGYAFKLLPEETTWRKLSIWPGEPPGQVRYVLPHPATINVLYAATDAGVYLSLDDGSSWTLRLPQIASMVKSDVFGETFFAVNVAGGLQYTADLGRTWKGSQDGLQNIFVGALAVVQDQGLTTVFAGTEHGVFSRAGSNAAWRLPTMERRVFALLPDANQRGTLLAGTEGHGVWMTNDGGETWRQTSAGMVPPFVYSIDSSRQGSSRLYAGTSAGLFRSTDHGQNWTPLTELVVAKALSVSIDPADSNVAYIGSLQGSVFKTTTGGLNFF